MAKVYVHLKSIGALPQITDIGARTLNVGTPTQRVEFVAGAVKEFAEQVDEYRKVFPGVPLVVALHRTFSGYWTPLERGANGWPLSHQPEAYWAALKEYMEGYEKLRKDHPRWPEFYYVVGAEMSNGGEDHVLFGKRCIETARTIPGFKVITCPNGLFEARTYAPLVDVMAPNYAVPMSDAGLKGLPSAKTQLWIYQAFNRFNYGFYAEKVKATGSFKEWYTNPNQRPYNDFDGTDLNAVIALPAPDGQVSIPLAEEFAWGITDFRYLKTLEEAIANAKTSRNPKAVAAAQDAAKFLADILGDINLDMDYYLNQAGFWDYSVYDTYRWRVAEQILKMKENM